MGKLFFDDMEYVLRDAAAMMGVHEETVMRRVRRLEVFAGQTAGDLMIGSVLNAVHDAITENTRKPGSGVTVNERTVSVKLGPVATTVAPRQTCPETCPFKGKGGCYPENDNTRRHWDRITAQARGKSSIEIARAEADGIDRLKGDRDLRLHVAGDVPDSAAACTLANAAARYVGRGAALYRKKTEQKTGRPRIFPKRPPRVWTYTHNWRDIKRHEFGVVSVLASCETVEDVFHAALDGYATAIVVPEFESDRAYDLKDGNLRVRVVPCPAQTHADVNCESCRLCMDDKKLHGRGITIGFAVHGGGRVRAKETLQRVALPTVDS